MKFISSVGLFSLILFLNSCSDKKVENEDNVSKVEALLDADQPQSLVKDSFTYYNGLQKVITIPSGEYFGFVFEADDQNLMWTLDQSIGNELAYISESFEPILNKSEKNGKQYFTFKAERKGKTKLQFKAKNSSDLKSIEIHIQ